MILLPNLTQRAMVHDVRGLKMAAALPFEWHEIWYWMVSLAQFDYHFVTSCHHPGPLPLPRHWLPLFCLCLLLLEWYAALKERIPSSFAFPIMPVSVFLAFLPSYLSPIVNGVIPLLEESILSAPPNVQYHIYVEKVRTCQFWIASVRMYGRG